MSGVPSQALRYQPYYCEENVWWLAGDPGFADSERQVVFISNALGCCRFSHQRAAPPGQSLFWDYHVVLAVRAQGWQIWDQDSRLGMPVAASDYLLQTFVGEAGSHPELAPRFRLIPGEVFRQAFASDRSHMRAADGRWLQPPPPWEPLGGGRPANLADFVSMDGGSLGVVWDLMGLLRRFGDAPDA